MDEDVDVDIDVDDDDFLAELDAMVSGDSTGEDASVSADGGLEPTENHRALQSDDSLLEDKDKASPSDNGRMNPFLQPPGESTPRPDVPVFTGYPTNRNESTSSLIDGPSNKDGMVSTEEFERMQAELNALRSFKYESIERHRQLAKLDEQKPMEKDEKKAVHRTLEKTMSFAGAFNKRLRNAAAKTMSGTKEKAAQAEQVSILQRRIHELESEIQLHKETKDQLAEELRNVTDDFHDQRMSYQSTIQDLTLKLNKIESTESAESAETSNENNPGDTTHDKSLESIQLLQKEQHNSKILESKCGRLGDEIKRQSQEIDSLRSQLRRVVDESATHMQDAMSARSETEKLKTDLGRSSAMLSESQGQQNNLKTSLSTLQIRLLECEDVMQSENLRANEAESEIGRLQLLLDTANESRKQLSKKQESESVESTALMGSLTVANKALTRELEEKRTTADEATASLTAVKEELALSTIEIDRLKNLCDKTQLDNDSLQARVTELEPRLDSFSKLEARLQSEEESRAALEQENLMLVGASEKLSATITAYEEALNLERKKVTDVNLESESLKNSINSKESNLQELERTNESLTADFKNLENINTKSEEQVKCLQVEIEQVTSNLDEVQSNHAQDIKTLKKKIMDLETTVSREADRANGLQQKLKDSEAQRKLDQKQNSKNLKTLTRQLKKQTESGNSNLGSELLHDDAGSSSSENQSNPHNGHSRSASLDTSSIVPLTVENQQSHASTSISLSIPQHAASSAARQKRRESKTSGAAGCSDCMKKDQKIAFYERHTGDLTADLQNKGKIIQSFMLRENVGKLLPPVTQSSPSKAKAKANSFGRVALALGVGKSKGAMTLELALEINNKLQQVIEDTLLQNIHLRESLDLISRQPP